MYQNIIDISRTSKKFLILGFDMIAILLAVTLAIMLRMSDPWPVETIAVSIPFYAMMLGLGLVLAPVLGIPQIKLSAFDLQSAAKVGLFALLLSGTGTILNTVLYYINVPDTQSVAATSAAALAAEAVPGAASTVTTPRTVPMIFGLVMFCLSIGWKLAAHALLEHLRNQRFPRTPVAVYGAGAAGIQLISALSRSNEFNIVAVVDDNPNLRGVMVGGHMVQPSAILTDLAQSGRIERILLGMPSLSKARQREIVQRLEQLPCEVQSLPAYVDIIRNGGLTHSLKPVSSDDLLGRDKVDLDIPEIASAYRGKSVLISGAGGSIGSELCRQILSCAPRRIVLFERSEFALYSIDREIQPLAAEAGVEVATVLGSVCDSTRVTSTLMQYEVEIVLHAAAYKHVPLVEENELEGVRNNIFGTRVLAEAASEMGCERFILISTDKAVRPTNVMGSTKRLAEMVIQDLARRTDKTRFAMVRFGNVLGSSGSVIPLFQSQIEAGGPITLTHPEVTRFFMTMPEAARLVLLAGSFADGGDVFVLDMGKPVRIFDLARRMIELSGLKVRDGDRPDGDIAIEVTGLRPGEKLYEELLIDADGLLATPHPKILRAEEFCPSELEVAAILQELRHALDIDSPSAARRQIEAWVEGYQKPEDAARTTAETGPHNVAAE